ncbi:oxidoreductase [Paractinoplanes abujensis]|uniref:Membrane-associated oxidoreductase n=1 Tax=Paractinoplanes abujensis TaxID=882441 RepID=A0A7W7FYV7_9ACTN|nr:hypothetical protein [Actinoplanes abujensis]MBB4691418.1 hypothetical protein [Actinoplanes abujensis]GID17169.1 oxidoreductase [Actinoplanes abujensis]
MRLFRAAPGAAEERVWEAVLATGEAVAPAGRPSLSAARLRSLLTESRVDGRPGPRWVRLTGFRIDGPLDLDSSEALRPLTLTDCAVGPISLVDGKARSLRLDRCDVAAIDLSTARIEGSLHVLNSTVDGRLTLRQATVSGTVNLGGTTIMGADGVALVGDRLTVGHSFFLRGGFVARQAVRLLGARVGGQLACDGAQFRGADVVLDLDAAAIGGNLSLQRGRRHGAQAGPFEAAGEVCLTGAKVDGSVLCDGLLSNPDQVALRGDNLAVRGNLVLAAGLEVTGTVRIAGAEITRNLECRAAALQDLNLTRTVVKGSLVFAPAAITGTAELTGVTAARLLDDIERWPADRELTGLRYDTIGAHRGPEPSVGHRVAWLPARYQPQPYEQLAAFYRGQGRDEDARRVAIARQRHRRREQPWWRRPPGYVLDATVGYGHRPGLALVWLAALLILGSLLFTAFHHGGAVLAKGGAGPTPAFNPPLFTLDLLLPVVNLRQRDNWVVVGTAAQYVSAVYVVLGWIIATAVVAALSGLLKKN